MVFFLFFFFGWGVYASLVGEVFCNYHKITYGTYLALIGPVMNLATSFDKTRITEKLPKTRPTASNYTGKKQSRYKSLYSIDVKALENHLKKIFFFILFANKKSHKNLSHRAAMICLVKHHSPFAGNGECIKLIHVIMPYLGSVTSFSFLNSGTVINKKKLACYFW